MPPALQGLADAARTKLWPLPTLAILVALTAAVALTELDRRLDRSLPGYFRTWIFGGGPEAARSILSAVATSLMTVTSLTFSLTLVTLQLASSQFSPRLLRTFTRDRFVQVTLALFLATFMFTLTVLRTIRDQTDQDPGFVPRLSVTATYLLTVASVIGLVLFLAHLAEEIRVETMLRKVHAEANATLDRTLKGLDSNGGHLTVPPAHTAPLTAPASGFITAIRTKPLSEAGAAAHAVVLVDRTIGSSVVRGTPIAAAWPADPGRALTDEDRDRLQDAVSQAVLIGFERTSVDDVAFGLRQLTDVAVKALSPGINDPTTATHALGHSAALLCRLAGLPLGDELVRSDTADLRVVVRRPTLGDLLELAVDQPLRYGSREPQVVERLYHLLSELGHHARQEDRPCIRRELARMQTAIDDEPVDDWQQTRYQELAAEVDAVLDHGRTGAAELSPPSDS